jgi:periplasmic divalent cation tolerance protein
MKEGAMTAEEFVIVLVTAGSAEEASGIGAALVEARLVACANVVGPIRSIYRWQGVVERAEEHLLLLKGRAADLAVIEAGVKALHSYDVPEVLALPIHGGSAAYLAWLAASTSRDA